MKALLLALALVVAQDQAAGGPETTAPTRVEAPPATVEPSAIAQPEAAPVAEPIPVAVAKAEELPFPTGAPMDDYGLVAWCYGALSGYLELHDRVLPEVTRIEGAYRRPGTRLEDDMATYDEMQRISRGNMKLFTRAMEAAERASIQPINVRGAAAVQQGRRSWQGAAGLPDRTVAQQWMGWALPVRCTPTATRLETTATLLGTAFKTDAADEPSAAAQVLPSAETPSIVPSPPQDLIPATQAEPIARAPTT
jgi:hypothetical protein